MLLTRQTRLATLAILGALLCLFADPARAQGFCDDFEDAVINMDNWQIVQQAGGRIRISSNAQHTGFYSAQFTSITGVNRDCFLRHAFDAPVYGTFTTWFLDPILTFGTASAYLGLWNSTVDPGDPTYHVHVGVEDTDGNYFYVLSPDGAGTRRTEIPRSARWHQLLIFTDAGGTGGSISIDDTVVSTWDADLSFDVVAMRMIGPGSRPNATFYFDDFCYTP